MVFVIVFRFVCSSLGNPNIDSLLHIAKDSPIDTLRANAYYKLGLIYWDSLYDKSIHYFEQSLKIAQKRDSWEDVADIHHRIAMVYFNQGEFDKSLFENQNSLSVYKTHGDSKGIGDVTNSIGIIYKTWGKYQKALEYFFLARDEYQKIGDSSGIGMAANNIGQIYFYQDEYQKAIEHFTLYYEISKSKKIPFAMAGAANNIAASLVELYQHHEAIGWYKEASDLYSSLGIAMGVAIINDNIGSLLAKDHDYERALEHHLKAIEVFSEIGNQARLAYALSNVGYVYFKLKQNNDALFHLKKSLQIAQERGLLETLKKCHFHLSQIFEATNNYSQALEHHKIYVSIKDSLVNIELTETLNQSELKHKSDQQQSQLAFLSQKVQQGKLFVLSLTLFAILFVALWLILIVINRKGKRQIEEYGHTIIENIKQLDETASYNIPILKTEHEIQWPHMPLKHIRPFKFEHEKALGLFVISSQTLPLNYLAHRITQSLNDYFDNLSENTNSPFEETIQTSVTIMCDELHLSNQDYSVSTVIKTNTLNVITLNTAVVWVSVGDELIQVDSTTQMEVFSEPDRVAQLFMLTSAVETPTSNYLSLVELVHKTLKLLLQKPEETQREIIRSTIESWGNSVDDPYEIHFIVQRVEDGAANTKI